MTIFIIIIKLGFISTAVSRLIPARYTPFAVSSGTAGSGGGPTLLKSRR
jgi:hypothetical protein